MPLSKIKFETDFKQSECKGRVYRYRVNSFVVRDRIEVKKSLRLLKRKSCPGCEKCGWMDEAIECEIDYYNPSDFLSGLEDGKMYRLCYKWYPGPYEYPDEGDLEIYFKEEKE